MAKHVDRFNMNDAMLSLHTFTVKEEQFQEDSFVEDKVCISETVISIDNTELQGPIWHGKTKQYEESTCLDNIKTELKPSEVTEVQTDNVKIEEGIISPNDIKIEYNNGLLYCEHCEAYYEDYCIKCGMLVHILNKHALNNADSGAQENIPNGILEMKLCVGQIGIYALRIIPAGVRFGPFTGLSPTECPWEMKGEKFVLVKNKSKDMNWMRYVNPTRNSCDGNLHFVKSEGNIYYQSTRQIIAREELLVYFGKEYRNKLNKIGKVDFVTTITKDIFACTFCCLGFSSKSHLAKHKTLCVVDAAKKFSIEELTQCPFCKIHLDPKEYFKHHMAFCCERNARKGILPTPPAKEATTVLSGRKICPRPIYKCEQCKYRTKYKADLKEHISSHHSRVKMHKCGICNRRFKTEETLMLHVENTHAYVVGKDNQKHSITDYRNTHIKVEQWSSQDQKKIFQCLLCVFRTKYKETLRGHIKTKHLKQFDFKCDSCEYRTNIKTGLKRHINAKHLKEFEDFKCDSCQYRTKHKSTLDRHIKSKHLKQFDFKCASCEYITNNRINLVRHVKYKHLKQCDYKCDSCEYITNKKSNLDIHIKTRHLKQFDFNCESCEYITNNKSNFEIHIRATHLRKCDLKCDSCEYRTYFNSNLVRHMKTKHLKAFDDFKCNSCEYRTTVKTYLKRHVKDKHLNEFNFKCDSCKFGTNIKHDLKRHIKIKHLKLFDYKCGSCAYGTDRKQNLDRHIKTNHLKEFDFKCDSCEYSTNTKRHLERHIKTKHLKQFDYKCDSCEYSTNHKNGLENHMKRKHL